MPASSILKFLLHSYSGGRGTWFSEHGFLKRRDNILNFLTHKIILLHPGDLKWNDFFRGGQKATSQAQRAAENEAVF